MPNLFGTIPLYGVTSFTIYGLKNDKCEFAMVEYIASIVNFWAALERGDSNPCKSKIRFHVQECDDSQNFKAHHSILFKNLIW